MYVGKLEPCRPVTAGLLLTRLRCNAAGNAAANSKAHSEAYSLASKSERKLVTKYFGARQAFQDAGFAYLDGIDSEVRPPLLAVH